MNAPQKFTWSRSAATVMAGVFVLFVWLNFGATRESYVRKADGIWQGGVRFGFPLTWWDSGTRTQTTAHNGRPVISESLYGGVNYPALAADLCALLAAMAAAGFLAEHAVRRFARGRDAPAPQTALRRGTLLAAALVAAAMLWANLRVSGGSMPGDGGARRCWEMGWPLPTYVACDGLAAPGEGAEGPELAAQSARWLRQNQHVSQSLSHWFMDNIAYNALAAAALVFAAVVLCERGRIRRSG